MHNATNWSYLSSDIPEPMVGVWGTNTALFAVASYDNFTYDIYESDDRGFTWNYLNGIPYGIDFTFIDSTMGL
jgi:hypothetical protein